MQTAQESVLSTDKVQENSSIISKVFDSACCRGSSAGTTGMGIKSYEWAKADVNRCKRPLGSQSDWLSRGFVCFGKERDG